MNEHVKWLEETIVDEMGKAITELDVARGITRGAESMEVCKRLIRMILGTKLHDEARARELHRDGEERVRQIAREMFKKNVVAHFAN